MRAALLLLLAALPLAGCAEEAPYVVPTPHPTQDAVEERGFRLEGRVEPSVISPGGEATARFNLTNLGPGNATYVTGGCGPAPWRFVILGPDRGVVGPLEPDPRCLGPPMGEGTLAEGASIEAALSWDGIRKWRDERHEVVREPVTPAVYDILADVPLVRDGENVTLALRLQLAVVEDAP